MKKLLSPACAFIITASSALGWIHQEPADYSKQLKNSDFVGIVEVTKIIETGKKKVILPDQTVQFRELRLEFKVVSSLKGSAETIKCSIYREPTEDELLADGVPKSDVLLILMNLGTNEVLHLLPARVTKGAHLLVYLKANGSDYTPVTGDLDSSSSLLKIEPSNLLSTLPRKQESEDSGMAKSDPRPESSSEIGDKPRPK